MRNLLRVVCDRAAWIAAGAVAGALSVTVFTQPPPPAGQPPAGQLPAPAAQAQAAASPRVLSGDAGLVLNFIKPDKTKDFEAILQTLKDALSGSAKAERKEQAKGWRVFKGVEPAAGGSALYVFIVDAPVKNADYAVTSVLGETMSGDELTQLTKQYVDSYASGQNFVNLTLVADFAK
jgi:hypothetical protein